MLSQSTRHASGFESLIRQRRSMQTTRRTLETLLAHGTNREATAIVRSFELTISQQEECPVPFDSLQNDVLAVNVD